MFLKKFPHKCFYIPKASINPVKNVTIHIIYLNVQKATNVSIKLDYNCSLYKLPQIVQVFRCGSSIRINKPPSMSFLPQASECPFLAKSTRWPFCTFWAKTPCFWEKSRCVPWEAAALRLQCFDVWQSICKFPQVLIKIFCFASLFLTITHFWVMHSCCFIYWNLFCG